MSQRRELTDDEKRVVRAWALREEQAQHPSAYVTIDVDQYVGPGGAISYGVHINARRTVSLSIVLDEASYCGLDSEAPSFRA